MQIAHHSFKQFIAPRPAIRVFLALGMAFCLGGISVRAAEYVPLPEFAGKHASATASSEDLLNGLQAALIDARAQAAPIQEQLSAVSAQLSTERATSAELRTSLASVTAERDALAARLKQINSLSAAATTIAAKLSGSEDTAVQYRDRWEAFTGARLGAAVWFLSMEDWDTAGGQFGATSYHLPRAAKLDRPVIFALGLGPAPLAFGTSGLDAILSGSKDAVFRREFAALAGFRPQDPHVAVRLGHECNGSPAWYAWGLDAAKYRAAWRRVAGIARTVSPRLQLVWCVNAYSADLVSYYPGNDVVDVHSFDHYHRGGDARASFTAALEHDAAGFARIADFARANGKPLAVDEWGAIANSGPWVDLFAAWLKAQGPLWHGYWDSNSKEATAISTGTAGTTADRYLANFRS